MKIKDFPMIRPILACLVLSCAGVALAAENAPPAKAEPNPEALLKSGVLLDRVVAVVNDGIVTESELNEQIGVISQQLREQKTAPPPPNVLHTQILDRLINQELQLQRAEKLGIKVADDQLNEAMTELAQRNNLTLDQLPTAMASSGIDYNSVRDNYRKEMVMQTLRRRDVVNHINVTPRELEQFIERIKRLPDPDSQYNTSHILLALPADATLAQVDEAKRKAEEIIQRAKTEDFSALAVAFSNSADALEGGSLGWRPGPKLPTIFQEIVVRLKPGEISQPMVDRNGVHLVRLNDKRSSQGDPIEDQVHARHILMKTNELQDDGIVKLKLAGIRERVQKGEDFSVFASSMSEDTGSAVNGGDLDWKGPGAFVPEFEEVISKLGDNEISEPFQTRYGWHIVQVLGRRKFDVTEDSLRDRAYNQLIESRLDEETQLWLRKMRDEAFIDTEM